MVARRARADGPGTHAWLHDVTGPLPIAMPGSAGGDERSAGAADGSTVLTATVMPRGRSCPAPPPGEAGHCSHRCRTGWPGGVGTSSAHLGDHGWRKIGWSSCANLQSVVSAITAPQLALLGGEGAEGEQVGAVRQGPERRPQAQPALWLSCTNAIEVQVDLDGGIQPETAPQRGGWLYRLTCQYKVSDHRTARRPTRR
jgi:hypothetical protein